MTRIQRTCLNNKNQPQIKIWSNIYNLTRHKSEHIIIFWLKFATEYSRYTPYFLYFLYKGKTKKSPRWSEDILLNFYPITGKTLNGIDLQKVLAMSILD